MFLSRRLRRRGAQAVEFALVTPLLVVILGGVVDTSWYLSRYSGVIQAARDGARSGTQEDSEEAGYEAARSARETLDNLGFDGDSATIRTDIVSVAGQDAIELQVVVPHDHPFGLPGMELPGQIEFSAVMRLEDQ